MPDLERQTIIEPLEPREVARVAIIVSRYSQRITDALLDGAIEEHARLTGGAEPPEVIPAPGSFELPMLAMRAATTGRYDAVVCLGCIIRGETSHDRYIAQSVTDGLTRVGLETGIAIGFGVLTVNDSQQAEARAGGAVGNKGAEAMSAALATAGALAALTIRAGRIH